MDRVASEPGSTLTASPMMKSSPHPRLERSAPGVRPAIRPGGPELVDERVVGGEHLDAIEATRLRPGRGGHEALDQLVDLGGADGMAPVRVVVGRQARRGPVRRERVVGVAVLPDVVQLLDQDDVGRHRAAGVGDAETGGDDRVVVGPEVAAGQDRGPVDRDRLDDDHAGAAERALAVVADVPRSGQAPIRHVRGVGAEGDPAAQGLVA